MERLERHHFNRSLKKKVWALMVNMKENMLVCCKQFETSIITRIIYFTEIMRIHQALCGLCNLLRRFLYRTLDVHDLKVAACSIILVR